MSIRNVEGKVEDLILVRNVLISVFDKGGLDQLVPGLIEANRDVRILSTGRTFGVIREILGESYERNLLEIAEYTGLSEMEGDLVKTIHPKIFAGILGERNNPEHQRYLAEELDKASYIDMVVVNLYPFEEVIRKPGVSFEKARGHIDIGGVNLIRAAAKNFLGCAVVCDPSDYESLLRNMGENHGLTSINQRFQLARKGFDTIAGYDGAISDYLAENPPDEEELEALYEFS